MSVDIIDDVIGGVYFNLSNRRYRFENFVAEMCKNMASGKKHLSSRLTWAQSASFDTLLKGIYFFTQELLALTTFLPVRHKAFKAEVSQGDAADINRYCHRPDFSEGIELVVDQPSIEQIHDRVMNGIERIGYVT